jgi:hypothetical protein
MFFDNHDKPEGRVTTQEKFLAERVINLHIVVIAGYPQLMRTAIF